MVMSRLMLMKSLIVVSMITPMLIFASLILSVSTRPTQAQSPVVTPTASPPVPPVTQPDTLSLFGLNTYFSGQERLPRDDLGWEGDDITLLAQLGRAAGPHGPAKR